MGLKEEVESKRRQISVDSYSMSVGELVNMYVDGEINLFPNFQRFFRWDDEIKSRLIESLLLNIPIPSIFVSQRPDGVWDVVDGLQRISAILQFMGKLTDVNGDPIPPLILKKTAHLPSLEGMVYQDEANSDNSFSNDLRLIIKRSKIDIVILKRESEEIGKYDLFQRLNTGGSSLSYQEIRNCMMVAENEEWFTKFEEMLEYKPFKESLRLSDRVLQERYDAELFTRYLCLRTEKTENIAGIGDIEAYLDNRIIRLMTDNNFDWEAEKKIFESTFSIINEVMGDEAFSKFDVKSQRFKGNFLNGAFEFVAIALGRKEGQLPSDNFDLRNRIINIWTNEIKGNEWKGANAAARLIKTLSLGDILYSDNEVK